MNMEPQAQDKLITCLECSARISHMASACPKCGTKYFRGVHCNLCKKILKASESATWDKVDQHPVPPQDFDNQVYHLECLQSIVPEVLSDSFPCRECGCILKRSSVVRWSIFSYERIPCPECGTPNPVEIGKCVLCDIPVFPASHHCVLTKPERNKYDILRSYYHATCYSLYFNQYLSDPYMNVFGWEAEYSKGHLIQESKGDEYAQRVLKLRCQKAREMGRVELFIKNLNGPFVSIWGNEIRNYGIAKKSLGIRNLTETDREMADKLAGWGYSVFVSEYPFTLMIRI